MRAYCTAWDCLLRVSPKLLPFVCTVGLSGRSDEIPPNTTAMPWKSTRKYHASTRRNQSSIAPKPSCFAASSRNDRNETTTTCPHMYVSTNMSSDVDLHLHEPLSGWTRKVYNKTNSDILDRDIRTRRGSTPPLRG